MFYFLTCITTIKWFVLRLSAAVLNEPRNGTKFVKSAYFNNENVMLQGIND